MSAGSREARREQKITTVPNNNADTPRKQPGRVYWHEPMQEPQKLLVLGPSKTAGTYAPSYSLLNFIPGKPRAHGLQHMYTINKREFKFAPWSPTNYLDEDVVVHVATDLTNLFWGQLVFDRAYMSWTGWPTWLTKLVVPSYFLRGPFGKGVPLLDFVRTVWNKNTPQPYYSIKRELFDQFIRAYKPRLNKPHDIEQLDRPQDFPGGWTPDYDITPFEEIVPEQEPLTDADLLAEFEGMDDDI